MKKSAIARDSARLSNEQLAADGMASVPEAIQRLGVCRATLYNMLKAGDVVGGLIRGKRVVSRVSIDRYIAARLQRTDRAS